MLTDVQSKNLKRAVNLILTYFYRNNQITLCDIGMRFRKDVSQTFSVSTNHAEVILRLLYCTNIKGF